MPTTAAPYAAFLKDLALGVHVFGTDTDKVALLTSAYTPNLDTNATFADVSSYEVAANSTTNYTAGGITLPTMAPVYDATNHLAKVAATGPTFSALNATFRYAVVYKSTGSASSSRLIGLYDFGEDRVYSSEDFVLVFTSGVVRIYKAS